MLHNVKSMPRSLIPFTGLHLHFNVLFANAELQKKLYVKYTLSQNSISFTILYITDAVHEVLVC